VRRSASAGRAPRAGWRRFHLVGADGHRALGHDDIAVEHHHLLDQVERAGLVGLDRQRLAAVGLLGCRGRGQACGEGNGQGQGGYAGNHEGTELADHSSGRSWNSRVE
jgi:hypothetical protein